MGLKPLVNPIEEKESFSWHTTLLLLLFGAMTNSVSDGLKDTNQSNRKMAPQTL